MTERLGNKELKIAKELGFKVISELGSITKEYGRILDVVETMEEDISMPQKRVVLGIAIDRRDKDYRIVRYYRKDQEGRLVKEGRLGGEYRVDLRLTLWSLSENPKHQRYIESILEAKRGLCPQ